MVHRGYAETSAEPTARLRRYGGQNLQDDPLWCESEPHKVTSQ